MASGKPEAVFYLSFSPQCEQYSPLFLPRYLPQVGHLPKRIQKIKFANAITIAAMRNARLCVRKYKTNSKNVRMPPILKMILAILSFIHFSSLHFFFRQIPGAEFPVRGIYALMVCIHINIAPVIKTFAGFGAVFALRH